MRLTLRTLLAYLDDTLEPEQAKLIGEKVAESDIAPELIERIKRVTRRRGLAAPPVTGESEDATSDPNMVAEYLDNELTSDQLGEIEQSALNSDAHLAEVAACHQILTLVLSEPAKVPPTARQRMYRVVKGRESIPYRKVPAANNVAGIAEPATAEENTEAEEALLLGMTSTRLLLPVVSAIVVALLLVGVVWMAIPTGKPTGAQGYIALAGNSVDSVAGTPIGDQTKGAGKKTPNASSETLEIEPRPFEAPPEVKQPPVVEKPVPPIVAPPEKPDPERKALARLETKDMLLLQRLRDTASWERAVPGKELHSTDDLMSLPGNRCEIKLDSGLRLMLWGSLPLYHNIPFLNILESRVTLHVPPQGFMGDFTLRAGRVFIMPPAKLAKDTPVRVRVRFREEVWDVTLTDPETEVCIDLLGFYPEGVPFSKEPGGPAPKSEIYFAVLKGKADLRVKFNSHPNLSAPTRIDWDSATAEVGEPKKIKPQEMEWWTKTIPENEGAKQMQAAVAWSVNRLSKPDTTRMEVIFFSAMEDAMEMAGRRIYSIFCLEALDAITYLADAISDDSPFIRNFGIRAMEHWCGQSPERDLQFYKLLIEKKSYTESQALALMQLTHPLSERDRKRPEIVFALFDALTHEKVAVRELAWQHLSACDPMGAGEIGLFDTNAEKKTLDSIVSKWKASWRKRFLDTK